jgi:hypothetical protein
LRSKSKDWLTRNQDNVSEWSDMSTLRLWFQRANTTNHTKCVGLIQSRHHHNLIDINVGENHRQSWMNKGETLATVQRKPKAIMNEQSRDTGHSTEKTKGNHEWTKQRHWPH